MQKHSFADVRSDGRPALRSATEFRAHLLKVAELFRLPREAGALQRKPPNRFLTRSSLEIYTSAMRRSVGSGCWELAAGESRAAAGRPP